MNFAPIPKGFFDLNIDRPVESGKCRLIVRRGDGLWGDEFGLMFGIWSQDDCVFRWWDNEHEKWIEIKEHPTKIAWIYSAWISRKDAFHAVLEANNQSVGVE